ncbi:hypothetical protein [Herpetosiphon sp. NSE202]|uniref:hypothetical protein n=1 Tax=Herpetosiphon sp. NSE202 TaxID=3351349 RepID=UPI0036375960
MEICTEAMQMHPMVNYLQRLKRKTIALRTGEAGLIVLEWIKFGFHEAAAAIIIDSNALTVYKNDLELRQLPFSVPQLYEALYKALDDLLFHEPQLAEWVIREQTQTTIIYHLRGVNDAD